MNAKPTPGPWVGTASEVYGKNETPLVADCARSNVLQREDIRANIALIVSSVNACFQVNPDNPLAVAEALPEIAETLKEASRYFINRPGNWEVQLDGLLRAALAKLEAKP